MRETCWGWGKEQHLYNTYLPIPSFLLSKNSLQGSQPTQAVAGSLLDTDIAAPQMSADKLWSWEQETPPPATHHHHSSSSGSRKGSKKRGVF